MTDTPERSCAAAQTSEAWRAELLEVGGAALVAAFEPLRPELAEPEKAAHCVARYLRACPEPAQAAAAVIAERQRLRTLAILLDQSHFLGDILFRYPEHFDWLCSQAMRHRARTAGEMLAEVPPSGSFEEFLPALRRFRQREILRIATREIVDHAPIASTTEDLANLADAALQAALSAAEAHLRPLHGTPRCEDTGAPCGFVILGMGKLGGRELNFSSDIDLLFVYAAEGETEGGARRSLSNAEYYKKLGELIIRALSELTGEGFIFRVDMRLRPHGHTGPLALPLEQTLEYYTDYGRAWERQAMLKARPCAGDFALGESLLEKLRSFVFPRYFDDATLEDVRDTKRQMEQIISSKGLTELEVKLGRGGIRDIEFTVQMLQLLNGGRIPDLRVRNTLEAIRLLGQFNCLRPFEADTLARNYVFLRQVEHRLQIEGGQQIHALPADAAALDVLARRLGYVSGPAFMNVYRDRTEENRRILEQFLAAKGSGTLWVGDLLNPNSPAEQGLEALRKLGFTQPEAARAELLALNQGPAAAPNTLHVRQRFAEIVPPLLHALAKSSQPDANLARLSGILSRLSAPGTLYDLLKYDPVLHDRLVALIANSAYLSQILARDPGLLDVVSTSLERPATREELESELRALAAGPRPETAPYRLRDSQLLRVAMRELVRGISVSEVGDELTLLAEVILQHVLDRARERVAARYGPSPARFCILALGKFGGREMGYASDLDLIFVYENDPAQPHEAAVLPSQYFAAVASGTLTTLKDHTPFGRLYDIDARLRPDGSKGILAVNDRRLPEYYLEDAQEWERLALMKVRAVAGDADFARDIEARLVEIAFSLPLTAPVLEHVAQLREQLIAASSPRNLKKSEGGLNDIEFSVRFLQLRHAADHPALKTAPVFMALSALERESLAPPETIAVLRAAYAELRRILNRVRMMDGRETSELPAEESDCAELARRLGLDGDLLAHVDRHRRAVARIWRDIFAETRALAAP
jgi:glutamate-ammonia-ligase adenylyltransferase